MRAYNKRKRLKHSYKGKYRLIDSDMYMFVEGGKGKEFTKSKQVLPKLWSLSSETVSKLIVTFSQCAKSLNKIFGLED